jgi:hypothetical protein
MPVAKCVARGVRLGFTQLTLDSGERFVSVSMKVAGDTAHTFNVSGRTTTVPVAFGDHHGLITVAFTEKIKVGKHIETIHFTRLYRRC